MKTNRGFTLAEILVAVGLLAIIGLILLTIYIRSLRGTDKSQMILSIKQNGQTVLENMDKTIRNADNPVVCKSSSSDTLVIVKDGLYTRYRFVLPRSTNSAANECSKNQDLKNASNGCIVYDNPTPVSSNTVLDLCKGDIVQDANILTDTNPKIGVNLIFGSFSIDKKSGFKDSVTINFQLGPAYGSFLVGNLDPVTFQTTVQLR